MTQQVVSLWVGDSLGYIERLSLASFVANGHPTALYTYGDVSGMPEGVEVRDAAAVLPWAEAQHYLQGSAALLADLFRLELQRQRLGLWVDTDVVCVRPVTIEGPFVAGRESNRFLNNAVLRLAPDAPILADWLAALRANRLPPWIRFGRAPLAYLRRLAGFSQLPSTMPHGTFGPKAITALAERYGLTSHAQPTDVFYPVHPRLAERLWDPTFKLADVVTERTLTVHLWNEKLRDLRKTAPPAGSILHELMTRYAITF